ncbi:MAG: hypothetical protein AAF640_11135, partial [Pseudomonadota bacterium]
MQLHHSRQRLDLDGEAVVGVVTLHDLHERVLGEARIHHIRKNLEGLVLVHALEHVARAHVLAVLRRVDAADGDSVGQVDGQRPALRIPQGGGRG